jgi:hypothetical protein
MGEGSGGREDKGKEVGVVFQKKKGGSLREEN